MCVLCLVCFLVEMDIGYIQTVGVGLPTYSGMTSTLFFIFFCCLGYPCVLLLCLFYLFLLLTLFVIALWGFAVDGDHGDQGPLPGPPPLLVLACPLVDEYFALLCNHRNLWKKRTKTTQQRKGMEVSSPVQKL